MITVCCDPRVGYIQLTAMFEASAAGARTGGIEHWMCSHCSKMHVEEATPAPEQLSSAEPQPMEVDPGVEGLPVGLNANRQDQSITHMKEEVIRVSSLPPAIPDPVTPRSVPPLAAAATHPTYETPLYLLSFQNQAHFKPQLEVPDPLPLLTSLFPRGKRTSGYEGIFTQRGAQSRARGLLKHLSSPVEPSNRRSSAATARG